MHGFLDGEELLSVWQVVNISKNKVKMRVFFIVVILKVYDSINTILVDCQ